MGSFISSPEKPHFPTNIDEKHRELLRLIPFSQQNIQSLENYQFFRDGMAKYGAQDECTVEQAIKWVENALLDSLFGLDFTNKNLHSYTLQINGNDKYGQFANSDTPIQSPIVPLETIFQIDATLSSQSATEAHLPFDHLGIISRRIARLKSIANISPGQRPRTFMTFSDRENMIELWIRDEKTESLISFFCLTAIKRTRVEE